MTGYATLATELRWLSDDDGLISQKMNEAADAIETLIRERDEARAKAIDEAVEVYRTQGEYGMEWHHWETAERAILALKDKP